MAGRGSGIAVPDTAHVSSSCNPIASSKCCGLWTPCFKCSSFRDKYYITGATQGVEAVEEAGCESGVGRSVHSCTSGHLDGKTRLGARQ